MAIYTDYILNRKYRVGSCATKEKQTLFCARITKYKASKE